MRVDVDRDYFPEFLQCLWQVVRSSIFFPPIDTAHLTIPSCSGRVRPSLRVLSEVMRVNCSELEEIAPPFLVFFCPYSLAPAVQLVDLRATLAV